MLCLNSLTRGHCNLEPRSCRRGHQSTFRYIIPRVSIKAVFIALAKFNGFWPNRTWSKLLCHRPMHWKSLCWWGPCIQWDWMPISLQVEPGLWLVFFPLWDQVLWAGIKEFLIYRNHFSLMKANFIAKKRKYLSIKKILDLNEFIIRLILGKSARK